MVIGCRSHQLMRSSKYVTTSQTLSFSTFKPIFRNSYVSRQNANGGPFAQKDMLARLCCGCRRFHSTDYFQNRRDTRPPKLSPQEVLSIINLPARSEHSSSLLERKEAGEPKGIIGFFNELIKNEPSEDRHNAVRDKIESFAGSINELVGAGVITISNDTVGISKAAVEQAIQSYVNLDSDNTTNSNDVDGGSKAEVHSSSNDKISDNDGNDEGRSSSDSGHVVQTDTISQYNETTEEPNVESESEAEISPDFKEKHPSAASDEFIQSFKNLDSENDDRIEISDVEEEENGGSNDQPDLLEDLLVTVLDENRVDGRSDLIASSRGLVSTVTSWLNEKLKTWLNNKFSSLNTYIGKLLTVFCLGINWSAASESVDRPSQNGRLETALNSLVSGTSSTSKSLDSGLDLDDVDFGLDGPDLSTLTSRLSAGSSRGIISNRVNKVLKNSLLTVFSSIYSKIGELVTYPLRYILNVFCLNINWSAASASVDRPSQNGRELLSDILRRTAGDSLSSRQRRAVPGDILQVLLNALVRTQTDRISDLEEKYDAAGDRISAFADWFNGFAGYDILVVSNTTVTTNSTAIIKVLEAIAAEQVQKKYSGNVLMLTFATSFVNSIIETTVAELNVSLDKSVSLDLVKNLVAVTTLNSTTTSASNSTISRKRRDAGFPLSLLESAFRSYVNNTFGTMYASVGYCLTNVSDTLTDLYTSENSSNPITQLIYTQINSVVVKAAALVTKLHNRLDTAFDSLVSGTSSTSKSLDSGLDLDVDGSDLLTLTSRLSAGSSRGIISNRVNRILKRLLLAIFSSLYSNIGALVTYPLRYLLNVIINTLFSCSSCTSLV